MSPSVRPSATQPATRVAAGEVPADRATPSAASRQRFAALRRQTGLVAALVLLVVAFSAQTSEFLTSENLVNVLLQGSVTAILAIGQMFVIVTAGIDLSIGTSLALGAVTSSVLLDRGAPIPAAMGVGLLVGVVAGAFNGTLVTRVRINPFIATLGTMGVFGGLAFLVTNGKVLYDLPQPYLDWLGGKLYGVPMPVIIMALIAVAAMVVLKYTRFGEYCVAIGGNAEVARLTGINVARYTTGAYVVAGVLAVLGGMILVARLGSADPTVGRDLMLPAIAAAVMGGASLRGGEGSVGGAVMGAMLIATLQSGLTLVNVQAYYQELAVGTVIILALALDRLQHVGRRRSDAR